MQLPILITWFLSLRYIFTLPQLYPSVTLPFLYLTNLCDNDPYFILPVLSATLSYFNISYSPAMSASLAIPPIFRKFLSFLKFMPFVSIPFVSLFPSGLCLYWCVNAFVQLLIIVLSRNKLIRR